MKKMSKLFSILFFGVLLTALLGVAAAAQTKPAGKDSTSVAADSAKAELNRKLGNYKCSYTGNNTNPDCDLDKIVKDLTAAKKSGPLSQAKTVALVINVYGPTEEVNNERWENLRDKLEGIGYNIDDYTLQTMTSGYDPKTMNKVTLEVK